MFDPRKIQDLSIDYVNRLRTVYMNSSRTGKPSVDDPLLLDIRNLKATMKSNGQSVSASVFNDAFKLIIDTLEVHISHCIKM